MSDVGNLTERLPLGNLLVWSNGRDFVVAPSEEGAREFLRQIIGERAAIEGGLEAPEHGWGVVPWEMMLSFDNETFLPDAWIVKNGPGYLGALP